jgi:hypothetical protein
MRPGAETASTRWERIGAICGIAFVVLLVITFFTPATPDLDDPIEQAIADIQDDENGLLLNFYLGGLAAIAFIGLIAAVWSRSRRLLAEAMPSGALLVAGGAFTALILLSNGTFFTLVAAVDEDSSPQAVEALLVLDNTLFIGAAFGLAALFAAFALVALAGALPKWLGWLAAAVAVLVVVGLLGVFSEDDEGGPLGVLVFIGFLLALVWSLATSIFMLTGRDRAEAVVERVGTTP